MQQLFLFAPQLLLNVADNTSQQALCRQVEQHQLRETFMIMHFRKYFEGLAGVGLQPATQLKQI